MHNEMVITDIDIKTRFQEERDLITYEPYRVGDRVVRCGNCRAVIKTEFVSNDTCPLCGCSPFIPALVNASQENAIVSEKSRSLTVYMCLLMLSAMAAYIPFSFSEASRFLCEASFQIGLEATLVFVGLTGIITVAVLYLNVRYRKTWQTAPAGSLLVLTPAAMPYLVLTAVWVLMGILVIMAVLVCCYLVIGLITCIFQQ